MINQGFALTIDDAEEMKKFKESSAYGNYLKSISKSPAFQLIMKEHINNVDVNEDLKNLRNQGKIPDGVNTKALSDLFKQSLSKMAIGLVADSVLLKEIEEVQVKEVIEGISAESDIQYLLGKADKKYYEQASKLIESRNLSEDSLGYRGLMTYIKQGGKVGEHSKLSSPKSTKPKPELQTISRRDSDTEEITL